MTYRHTHIAAGIYIALPIIIFFAGWLKIWIAIPAIALCLISLYSFIREERERDDEGLRFLP